MLEVAELVVGGGLIVYSAAETMMAPILEVGSPTLKTVEARDHHLRKTLVAGLVGAVIVGHAVYSLVVGS